MSCRMKPSYGRTVPGWAPIAVLAFKDFAHNSQALLQTLQLLERLAVFMLVCGWTGKQHDDRYKAILDDWDSATSLARHSSSADLWRGTALSLSKGEMEDFLEALNKPVYATGRQG